MLFIRHFGSILHLVGFHVKRISELHHRYSAGSTRRTHHITLGEGLLLDAFAMSLLGGVLAEAAQVSPGLLRADFS